MVTRVTVECDYCRKETELSFKTAIPPFEIMCESCGTRITNADIVDSKVTM